MHLHKDKTNAIAQQIKGMHKENKERKNRKKDK